MISSDLAPRLKTSWCILRLSKLILGLDNGFDTYEAFQTASFADQAFDMDVSSKIGTSNTLGILAPNKVAYTEPIHEICQLSDLSCTSIEQIHYTFLASNTV